MILSLLTNFGVPLLLMPEKAVAIFSREQARYADVVRKAGVMLD